MAYSSKYFDKIDNKYFVLLGDAEIAEGSIWEACNFASEYKLDNLVAFVDCNRFG
jgi:transketolase